MIDTSQQRNSASPTRARRLLWRGISLGVAVALVVAAALGVVDGVLAVGSGGPGVVLLSLGLYLPLGALLGLLLGAVVGGVAATRGEDAGPLWPRLCREPALDLALAGALIAGGICVLVEVGLIYGFARGVAATMANPRLAALSTALVGGAGLALVLGLFFPSWQLLRGVLRLVPRGSRWPVTASVSLLAALVVVAAAAKVIGGIDWRVLRFGPWLMLGAMLLISAIVVVLTLRGRSASGQPRVRFGLLAAGLLLAVGAGLASPALGGARAVAAAQEHGLLLPRLIDVARRFGDGDRDGYSAWFSGGDCDDDNPAVHPGARDVPDNGVDENCAGGDAKRRAKPASIKRSTASAGPTFDGNVLLVCIDTLRSDLIGRRAHLTPNMTRLARGAADFRRAYAQAPRTPQSFPSIFTSLYPSRVPYENANESYPVVKASASSMFELLAKAGIATAAVTSHFYFTDERGITQGVESWDNRGATNIRDSNKDVAAPRLVPRALKKLEALARAKRRFVLFLHLFEPHSTYVKHDKYRAQITERGVKGLRQKYDYEVKFVDDWVGTLMEGIERLGLSKRTALILFSDHGEAFGEHKFYFHGQALYEEVLRVPLLLRVPGVAPRVIDERVALLDVAPTVLELFGLPVPESFQGISLLPLAHGERGPADRPVGAELMPYPAWPKGQVALLLDHHKALLRVTENRFEAYDLRRDPTEQHNLSQSDPKLAARLRRELVKFQEQWLQ